MLETTDKSREDIQAEMAKLTEALGKLNDQKVLRIYGSPWRIIGMQFLRGMVFGLGTVLGAGVLVSVLVYSLAQIQFIPVIGDFARDVITEIEQTRQVD